MKPISVLLTSVGLVSMMAGTQRVLAPPPADGRGDHRGGVRLGHVDVPHPENHVLSLVSERLRAAPERTVRLAWQERHGRFTVAHGLTYDPRRAELHAHTDGQTLVYAPVTAAGIRTLVERGANEGFEMARTLSRGSVGTTAVALAPSDAASSRR